MGSHLSGGTLVLHAPLVHHVLFNSFSSRSLQLCVYVAEMYISRLSDALPTHFYAGLLQVGDQVVEINHVEVSQLSLDAVFDIIAQSSMLLLRLRPSIL